MAEITVADAQRIAAERDKSIVMLIGWNSDSKRMSVVTFGRDGYEAAVQRLHDQVSVALSATEEYADQLAARTADADRRRSALLTFAQRVSAIAASLNSSGWEDQSKRLNRVVADMIDTTLNGTT